MAKDKEVGRKLRADKRRKQEVKEIGGVLPARGMWLVNPKTRRVAGRILRVRKNGKIVVLSLYGSHVEHDQDAIINNGYQYTKGTPRGKWVFLPDIELVPIKDVLAKYEFESLDQRDRPLKHQTTRQKKEAQKEKDCLCGCGGKCRRYFLPGHDAKFKSRLGKASPDKPMRVTKAQQDYLDQAKWMTADMWLKVKTKEKDNG